MNEDMIRRKLNNRIFFRSCMVGEDILPDLNEVAGSNPEIPAEETASFSPAIKAGSIENVSSQLSGIGSVLAEASANLNAANSLSFDDGYREFSGNRIKVFIKKVLRKLMKVCFGWYIFPILQRQTEFNQRSVNALDLLVQAENQRTKAMADILSIVNGVGERLNELNKQLDTEQQEIFEITSDLITAQEDLWILSESLEKSCYEYKQAEKSILSQLDAQDKKIRSEVEKVLTKNEEHLNDIRTQLDVQEEKLRSEFEEAISKNGEYISGIRTQLNVHEERLTQLDGSMEYVKSKLNISYDPAIIEDDVIDYFEFEDYFRGSREEIKNRQKPYLHYLKTEYTDGTVLELGFGRGELLELMRENGIEAMGVDCYPPFVRYCSDRGYNVRVGDALTFLTECEDDSLNGIVLSQVAEHVNTDYLYQLIRTGYRKLRKGCCFLIETPNSESLSTYTTFYVDGSHLRPVHYWTLEYIFRSNGYSDICRYAADYSLHPFHERIKKEFIDNNENAEQKQLLNDINQVVFGRSDYTIIARK